MADSKTARKTTTKKSAAKSSSRVTSTGARRGRPPGSKNKNSVSKLSDIEKNKQEKLLRRKKRLNQLILAVVLLAISAFLIISIYTEVAGALGRGISYLVFGLFGYAGYFLPFYFLIYSILLLAQKAGKTGKVRTTLFLIAFFAMISALFAISSVGNMDGMEFGWRWIKTSFTNGTIHEGGGAIGMCLAFILVKILGTGGAYIIGVALLLITLLIVANEPFAWILERTSSRKAEKEEYRREMEEEAEAQRQYEMELAEREINNRKNRNTDLDNGAVSNLNGGKGSDSAHGGNVSDEFDEAHNTTIKEPRKRGFFFGAFSPKESADKKKRSYEEKNSTAYGLGDEDYLYSSQFYNGARKGTGKIGGAASRENSASAPIESILNKIDSRNEGLRDVNSGNNSEKNLNNGVGGVGGIDEDNLDFNRTGAAKGTNQNDASENGWSVSEFDSGDSHNNAATGESAEANSDKSTQIKKEKMDEALLNKEIQQLGKNLSTTEESKEKEIPYEFPPISLLKGNVKAVKGSEIQELNRKAKLLEDTLASFNVHAKVIDVSKGPAVTRFEIQPDVGVKVNSIVRLQDDIALNLAARSIRMEAPIPGKAAVGIEIENDNKKPVFLKEVIETPEFKNSSSKITFAVGRNISGNPVVANLKDMPHLLIAGSTGSGKSVCINSIIMSLLYKASPDEVKIILVDPKVVELSNYNGIPHLLIPVVNEANKAAVALNWAVSEMTERYNKFAEAGVKDLSSYNKKAEHDNEITRLPQIVIIIDELADLMMAAPQQVEDAICRLAQMARAAGMHLIVATQRPSVDVITGVIKANIPSRIAFAVSSQIDSRTILDMAGAEKLVGKGDMLFNPLGIGKPIRVQGTFVSDEEVQSVIEFISRQGHKQEFSNDLIHTMETDKIGYEDDNVDELLKDAIELVVNAEQASVSMLQRRFRIGYNRAARLVDMMEARGIVGPSEGSKARTVLLTKAALAELDRAQADIERYNRTAQDLDSDNMDNSSESRLHGDITQLDSDAEEYLSDDTGHTSDIKDGRSSNESSEDYRQDINKDGDTL